MQYFKPSVILLVLATLAQADVGIPDAWHTAVASGVSQLQAAQLFVGASTGYLQKGSTAVWNFGVTDLASGRATDDRSIYEIGSVSKSFVGIMLAEQIGEGKVALLGTVDQYLPQFHGTFVGGITLQQLDAYAGGYSCATTGLSFQVSRRGGDLIYVQNGGRALLRAKSATDFGFIDGLYPAGWNSVSFDVDGAGEVAGLIFHTKDDLGHAQPDVYCLRDGITGRANSSEVAGGRAGTAGITPARSRTSLDPAFGAL